LAVLADGKIVVSGSAFNPDTNPVSHPVVARYTPDGQPDTSFGPSGTGAVVFALPDGTAFQGGGLGVQADGRLLVGGTVNDGHGINTLAVLRVNGDNSPTGPAGTVDTGYGMGGYATALVEYSDSYNAITVGPDGKVIIAGRAVSSPAADRTVDVALARFLPSAPQVGSFAAAPNPAAAGDPVTLTAGGITNGNPGATVTRVTFSVLNANGTETVLGDGTRNADGTWSLTFSTAGWAAGTYTLLARATDSYGAISDPLSLGLEVV
jgi:uncharacterized delta-60 repeat protein